MKVHHGLLLVVGFSSVAAACSASSKRGGSGSSFGAGGDHASTGSGTSVGGATANGSGAGNGGGISFGDAGLDASACPTHCSSDLHSIIDCNGLTVTTCDPTQGCGATGCVDACASASANQSTIGCEYYSINPDVITEGSGACFAAFIANTWNAPVTLTVDRGGTTLDPSTFSYLTSGTGQNITYTPLVGGQIPVGEVAIVFLGTVPGASVSPCPKGLGVALTTDTSVPGTGLGAAYHITSSAPVVAYDVFPYGGGQSALASATLLLPTTAWDTNYIAVDAWAASVIAASANAVPDIAIVAAEDGTEVTISPVAAIAGGTGVAAAAKGVPTVYNLDKGQYVQFSQHDELTGSVIQSNKPVGTWGGASCLNIDVNTGACDAAHQQIPPVRALGFEYVAVRYRNRFAGMEESSPWRMVGAIDGTTLTYDPATPAGAPTTLGAGQVAEFRAPGPFTVTSQDSMHPFYMSGHMTGCEELDPSGTDCRGDPEFVNVIPPQQYLASYVFFTDPTYPETDLVLVRSKGTASTFSDVTLDCAGVVTGWMPVGTAGDFEYTRVDLVTGNFVAQGNCNNGPHEIHSDGPFGLTVWGWGSAATGGAYGCTNSSCKGYYSQAVSYAYPAGASVQPINQVVIPPMAF